MQNGGQAAAAVPAKEGKDAAQSFPERDGTGESDANNHKLSNVLDKDDESAIEPDVPHELSSSENAVPAGPWLQYLGQREGRWQGSALLLLPPSKLNMQQQPILTYSAEGPELRVQGRQLDQQDNWTFWRFNIEVAMTGEEQAIVYSVDINDPNFPPERRTFYVPAVLQPAHWGFHSCNGLSVGADLGKWGEPALWRDVMARHQEAHLHVIVGGGDQIYNDGFWKTKPLESWLNIHGVKERLHHPFTLEMEQTLSSWLLNHYRMHFSLPLIKPVFQAIPQANIWDDHDIWDGWGSYPEPLQTCPVFLGVFAVCRRFYLLYQHHTTLETVYEDNDMFGTNNAFSFLRMMGPNQAVLCPDTRSERTLHQVMSAEHYNLIFERLAQLPASVKHLVIVFTVPVTFPKLPLSETVLSTIEGMPLLKGAIIKTGVGAGIMDKFETVSLLDDLQDHWDSAVHLKERNALIHRLQEHARAHGRRVSFISGDVHCAQVGRLYTSPKMKHLQHDPCFMPQITSSAIWNEPPPHILLNLLQKLNHAGRVNKHTKEKTVKIFKPLHPQSPKLLGLRNWCEVREQPGIPADASGRLPRTSGLLQFMLRAEDPERKGLAAESYIVPVPIYIPSKNAPDVRMTYKTKQWFTCFSTPLELDPIDEF